MWIRNYTDEILEHLIKSRASYHELGAFEEYMIALRERDELLERYPGSSIFQAPKIDKELLNDYSTRIINYEVEIMGSPIYEDLKKKYEDQANWPQFLKEGRGVHMHITNRETEVANAGWYQNKSGNLYHYDGVVWDVIPPERIVELEYLG